MLWLRLKLNLLPCISEEVTRVSELYFMLLQETVSGDKQKLRDMALLQASIRGRIQELEEFYELNAQDPTIGLFEKQRLRLRKLLQSQLQSEEPDEQKTVQQAMPSSPPKQQKEFNTDDLVKNVMQKPTESARRDTSPSQAKAKEWKEIVFRIKLTPEEYNRLMVLKARKMKL